MYCKFCGKQLPVVVGSRCPYCGQILDEKNSDEITAQPQNNKSTNDSAVVEPSYNEETTQNQDYPSATTSEQATNNDTGIRYNTTSARKAAGYYSKTNTDESQDSSSDYIYGNNYNESDSHDYRDSTKEEEKEYDAYQEELNKRQEEFREKFYDNGAPLPQPPSYYRRGFIQNFVFCVSNPLKFSGRMTRGNFVRFCLAEILIIFLASMLCTIISVQSDELAEQIILAFSMFFELLTFSVYVRRLHDISMSGWWVLIKLVPIVNIILFLTLLFKGSNGINRFGTEQTG